MVCKFAPNRKPSLLEQLKIIKKPKKICNVYLHGDETCDRLDGGPFSLEGKARCGKWNLLENGPVIGLPMEGHA
ncbi:MAG: hypothetical protein PHH61_06465 [Candidatus Nanoarchaeia archaeon]|jgi:hypothetical protein|nr:hypothetical protein [Candidatus Nanoarchaeia archaeon]